MTSLELDPETLLRRELIDRGRYLARNRGHVYSPNNSDPKLHPVYTFNFGDLSITEWPDFFEIRYTDSRGYLARVGYARNGYQHQAKNRQPLFAPLKKIEPVLEILRREMVLDDLARA